MSEKEIPTAFYGCAVEACSEEVSHRPEDLMWVDATADEPAGWYCDGCIDGLNLWDKPGGIKLSEYLNSQEMRHD